MSAGGGVPGDVTPWARLGTQHTAVFGISSPHDSTRLGLRLQRVLQVLQRPTMPCLTLSPSDLATAA